MNFQQPMRVGTDEDRILSGRSSFTTKGASIHFEIAEYLRPKSFKPPELPLNDQVQNPYHEKYLNHAENAPQKYKERAKEQMNQWILQKDQEERKKKEEEDRIEAEKLDAATFLRSSQGFRFTKRLPAGD